MEDLMMCVSDQIIIIFPSFWKAVPARKREHAFNSTSNKNTLKSPGLLWLVNVSICGFFQMFFKTISGSDIHVTTDKNPTHQQISDTSTRNLHKHGSVENGAPKWKETPPGPVFQLGQSHHERPNKKNGWITEVARDPYMSPLGLEIYQPKPPIVGCEVNGSIPKKHVPLVLMEKLRLTSWYGKSHIKKTTVF